MTLRLLPSDPLFAEWDALMTRYAQIINAHMFVDPAWFRVLPEPERVAFVAGYEADMRETFEELTR